jgi:hypothetical protein
LALKNAEILGASPDRAALTFAGLVFATCGQGQKAETNAAKFNKEYPLDNFLLAIQLQFADVSYKK